MVLLLVLLISISPPNISILTFFFIDFNFFYLPYLCWKMLWIMFLPALFCNSYSSSVVCCTKILPWNFWFLSYGWRLQNFVLWVPCLWSCSLAACAGPSGYAKKILIFRDPTVIAYTAFPGELRVFCRPKLIKPHDIHGRQISINHNK